MKLFTDMYDHYLAQVHNCTYVAGAQALRRAAQEFCERTQAWRVTMDTSMTPASGVIHDFDITFEQEVHKVLSATLDGQDLQLRTGETADSIERCLITLNPREYMLQPKPPAGMELIIKAVLKPSNDSTGLEDFLYGSFARVIADGAKADLFGQLSMPFGNAGMADRMQARFDEQVARIKIQVARAHSNAPLRTIPSFM